MYIVVGVIYILAGIVGLTYVVKNSENMEPSVFGMQPDKYQVINKKKFNRLMVVQSILIVSFFFAMATMAILYEKPIVIVMFPCMILINIVMGMFARTHVASK